MVIEDRIELTREELYKLVWETPVTRLAKNFGISNVGLRKVCVRHQIPTPPLGYWAKLAHGKVVACTPLPQCEGELRPIYLVRRGRMPVSPELEAEQKSAIASNTQYPPIVVVGELPPRLHTVAVATAQSLHAAKADHEGFKTGHANGGINIALSGGSIERALRIINAFVRAIEERGYSLAHHANRICIVVDDIPFDWSFHEMKDKKKHEPTKSELRAQAALEAQRARWGLTYSRPPKAFRSWDFYPSGRLAMTIRDATLPSWQHAGLIGTWRDRKGRRLEDFLDAAMTALVEAAVAIRHRLTKEAERKRAEEAARERRRLEAERRERERKLRDYLITMAEEHARYRRLQELASYLKREFGSSSGEPADRLLVDLELVLRGMEKQFSRESIGGEIASLRLFADNDRD